MPSTRTTKSKSRSKAPVKKPASKIPAEEVSPQVATAHAYPSVKVEDKRRAPVTSDSDIEILETPPKHKKAKMTERPSPGSLEFEDLSPVTISNKARKVAASKVAKKLSFGSPGAAEYPSASKINQFSSPVAITEEKRGRKPSAKAQYMLQAASVDAAESGSDDSDWTPPPTSQIVPIKSLKNNPSSQVGLFSPEPEASVAGLVDDETVSVRDEASVDEAAAKSDNDTPHHAIKEPVLPTKHQTENKLKQYAFISVASGYKIPMFHSHIENSADDSEEIPLAMLPKVKKPQIVTSKAASKARDSGPGSPMIEKEPCHLEPFISLINEAKQRGEIIEKESTMPVYEMVVKLLGGIGARNFKCAHNFSVEGLFVNPGKAAVNGIGISDNRVVVAGGRTSIIFVSNGCVAACNLFIPGTNGSGVHINRVKKIGIWPLNEEFDALTAYFGAVYGVSQFYCSFFGDILTFQTQVEKTGSSNYSGPSTRPQSVGTPQKSLPCFGTRTPSKSRKSAVSSHSFPPFLRFDEQVPIYDVRKTKFNFNPESFASLSSLPLYHGGISDLPQNAAVTVGYTVNTYPYNQKEAPSNSLALSLNIQFVILHGYIVPQSTE